MPEPRRIGHHSDGGAALTPILATGCDKEARQIVVRPDQIVQRDSNLGVSLSFEGVVLRFVLISSLIMVVFLALGLVGMWMLTRS